MSKRMFVEPGIDDFEVMVALVQKAKDTPNCEVTVLHRPGNEWPYVLHHDDQGPVVFDVIYLSDLSYQMAKSVFIEARLGGKTIIEGVKADWRTTFENHQSYLLLTERYPGLVGIGEGW